MENGMSATPTTRHASDVIVIGAGIVGIAIAAIESERGRRVTLLEREERPVGASVRNFGLVWPMGQPAGPLWNRALRARNRWLEFSARAGFHAAANGSLHLAHTDLEKTVLEEFLRIAPADFAGHWLEAAEIPSRCAAVKRDGLIGGVWSPHEATVDGREALPKMLAWLAKERGVDVRFDAAVSRVEAPEVVSAAGVFIAPRIYVCTGAELRILFPEVLRASGITNCKLQMWRTPPQPGAWRLGPSLCAGLTLLHYAAFSGCPSLPLLRQGFEKTHPEFIANGIHVLVSQNGSGEIILGDTHHYGLTHDPFLHERLDALVERYFHMFAGLPDNRVAERWMGVYAKLSGKTEFIHQPQPGVTIVNALGGAGMTLSFGLAEEIVPL
jgi:D-hydroxyproline dehydrogenase subunit beta